MTVLENTVSLHEIAGVVNSSGPTGSALSHCAVDVIVLGNLLSRQTTAVPAPMLCVCHEGVIVAQCGAQDRPGGVWEM